MKQNFVNNFLKGEKMEKIQQLNRKLQQLYEWRLGAKEQVADQTLAHSKAESYLAKIKFCELQIRQIKRQIVILKEDG